MSAYSKKTIIESGNPMASESHLTKKEREQLHKSFDYENYVKSFARWAAFYGFLIGSGGGTAWIYLATYQDAVVIEGKILFLMALVIGVAMGGALGTLAVWVRASEYREMIVEYRLDEYALPQFSPAEAGERAASLNGERYALERQSKTVEYAQQMFTFSGKQLDSMKEWVRKGYGKVRRDSSPEGPGLSSIGIKSADYSQATMVLKGRGLIDDKYEWTAKGVNWLESE